MFVFDSLRGAPRSLVRNDMFLWLDKLKFNRPYAKGAVPKHRAKYIYIILTL